MSTQKKVSNTVSNTVSNLESVQSVSERYVQKDENVKAQQYADKIEKLEEVVGEKNKLAELGAIYLYSVKASGKVEEAKIEESKYEDLKKKAAKLEKELDVLKKEEDQLKQDMAKPNPEEEKLKRIVTDLQDALNSLKASKRPSKKNIKKYEDALAEKQKELAQEQKVSSLMQNKALSDKHRDVTEKEKELTLTQNSISSYESGQRAVLLNYQLGKQNPTKSYEDLSRDLALNIQWQLSANNSPYASIFKTSTKIEDIKAAALAEMQKSVVELGALENTVSRFAGIEKTSKDAVAQLQSYDMKSLNLYKPSGASSVPNFAEFKTASSAVLDKLSKHIDSIEQSFENDKKESKELNKEPNVILATLNLKMREYDKINTRSVDLLEHGLEGVNYMDNLKKFIDNYDTGKFSQHSGKRYMLRQLRELRKEVKAQLSEFSKFNEFAEDFNDLEVKRGKKNKARHIEKFNELIKSNADINDMEKNSDLTKFQEFMARAGYLAKVNEALLSIGNTLSSRGMKHGNKVLDMNAAVEKASTDIMKGLYPSMYHVEPAEVSAKVQLSESFTYTTLMQEANLLAKPISQYLTQQEQNTLTDALKELRKNETDVASANVVVKSIDKVLLESKKSYMDTNDYTKLLAEVNSLDVSDKSKEEETSRRLMALRFQAMSSIWASEMAPSGAEPFKKRISSAEVLDKDDVKNMTSAYTAGYNGTKAELEDWVQTMNKIKPFFFAETS
ncbi:MAG: hypothetical protein M1125_02495 [Candidatus Marsarchaeota archaeon]|nr:hypothetical protein [Candidatus Marsarchaeota archaeon]